MRQPRGRDKFSELLPFFIASLFPAPTPSAPPRAHAHPPTPPKADASPTAAAPPPRAPPPRESQRELVGGLGLGGCGLGVQFSARVRRLVPPWSRWNR